MACEELPRLYFHPPDCFQEALDEAAGASRQEPWASSCRRPDPGVPPQELKLGGGRVDHSCQR